VLIFVGRKSRGFKELLQVCPPFIKVGAYALMTTRLQ